MTQKNILTEFSNALALAISESGFIKLALSKPNSAVDLKSIDVRLITVKRRLKLSFTYHHQTRDIIKNYTIEEALQLVVELLQGQFNLAKLYTNTEDVILAKTPEGYSINHTGPKYKEIPALEHDRAKQYSISTIGKPYLHALGIADSQGKIYKTTQDKFRQINKYIEIVERLIKSLPKQECLRIVDMGCGKGYLTFALYDHLVNTMQINAKITGVEFRADLVKFCNNVAQMESFNGLNFAQGTIADFDCTGADVVIALHACDTATDDAIYKAIHANSSLIVVAPCCHKQIRREMNIPTNDNPLEFLVKYGTYTERIAEMVTDGMRAKLMEISGYSTNLFEFISDAHTAKNVMIVATKLAAPLKPKDIKALHNSFIMDKAHFGVVYHHLERLLGLRDAPVPSPLLGRGLVLKKQWISIVF